METIQAPQDFESQSRIFPLPGRSTIQLQVLLPRIPYDQLASLRLAAFLEPALSRTLSSGGTSTHGHLLAMSYGVGEITKPNGIPQIRDQLPERHNGRRSLR